MSAFWHDPQSERLVAAHINGARPAWVWDSESERRIWRNRAAIAYEAARRRQPGDTLAPVPRQIPRTVRMGMPYVPSLSHLQFAIGRKPVSATCTCTPVFLQGNEVALLVVMQTPLNEDELAEAAVMQDCIAPFLDTDGDYVLVGADGSVLADGGDGARRLAEAEPPARDLATGADSRLLLFAQTPVATDAAPAEDTSDQSAPEPPAETSDTAFTVPDTPETNDSAPADPQPSAERQDPHDGDALVSLIDRLDSRQVLYQPLGEQDDGVFGFPEDTDAAFDAHGADENDQAAQPAETQDAAHGEPDAGADNPSRPNNMPETETQSDAPAESDEATSPPTRKLWKVVGHGLSLLHGSEHEPGNATGAGIEEPEPEAEPPAAGQTGDDTLPFDDAIAGTETPHAPQTSDEDAEGEPADSEFEDIPAQLHTPDEGADAEIEQTSRYNFDELSRILNDRVSGDPEASRHQPDPGDSANAGALVNLGDETLILNRLPIGLLVFRDQQILFNNRAFTDLLGHVDGTSLRRTGLSGVFPSDGDQESAGPVTKLMGADGRILSVSARLQVISWQGRQALMLSATRHQEPPNAEHMARTFASFMANTLDFGYFETSRAGIVTSISGQAAILSHRRPDALINRPIHSLIALSEGARLRSFLEQPARFAGGERPSMRFDGAHPGSEIVVFAEGMAGIVTGYFGFIRARIPEAPEDTGRGIDPDFLIRLSRAMRQPINAITGFAEMIRNQSFGPIKEERYVDYGRFIHGAGRDIAAMIDELEDYARLRDENYPLAMTQLSLIDLLASAMVRVRPYAAATRVFIRSSISASLPDISADGETLIQAVLNVLATAVAHSPTGGQVVLSAQRRGDGGIEIHVRDSGHDPGESIEESFMVFRDGEAADGERLTPMPSAIGFALTRTLLKVNSVEIDIDPDRGSGMLFSLIIPAELVVRADSLKS